MVTVVAFVVAAGIGAVCRLVARHVLAVPWATLAANLVGAFALGLVVHWQPPVSTVVGTAGIGALTTFSTMSAEVVTGWRTARRATILYLFVTVVGGIGLAWLGMELVS